jgi:hypothetical protein
MPKAEQTPTTPAARPKRRSASPLRLARETAALERERARGRAAASIVRKIAYDLGVGQEFDRTVSVRLGGTPLPPMRREPFCRKQRPALRVIEGGAAAEKSEPTRNYVRCLKLKAPVLKLIHGDAT